MKKAADTNIDNSQVGKLLYEMVSGKKAYDQRESSLKQQLLEKILQTQIAKNENPQKVLDSAYFNGMSLTEKVDFLNKYKNVLKRDPKFGWSNVFSDVGTSAFLAGSGTLMHQIVSNATAGTAFKANPIALGTAIGLGALVGGTLSANREIKDYNRDLETQKNIDNAISMLVHRSRVQVPPRVGYGPKITATLEDVPLTVGINLSPIDFDKLRKRGNT